MNNVHTKAKDVSTKQRSVVKSMKSKKHHVLQLIMRSILERDDAE